MKKKVLVRFIGLFIFVGVLLSIVGFYLNTSYLEQLAVEGNVHNSREEILEIVGFNDKTPLLDILLNKVHLIENIGYIDKIEVDYIDLTRVHIVVTEKEVVGYTKYMGKYLCVDSNGYILDYSESKDEDKPVIKGLLINDFVINEPLDVSPQVVHSVNTIYRLSKTFNLEVEWIDYNYSDGDEIILRIEPVDVHIGDISRIEEKLESIEETLSILPDNKKGVLHVEDVDGNIIFQSLDED